MLFNPGHPIIDLNFNSGYPTVLLKYKSNKVSWFYLIVLHSKSIDYYHERTLEKCGMQLWKSHYREKDLLQNDTFNGAMSIAMLITSIVCSYLVTCIFTYRADYTFIYSIPNEFVFLNINSITCISYNSNHHLFRKIWKCIVYQKLWK